MMAHMAMKTFKTVDAYIKSFPSAEAKMLRALRQAIVKAAPKAEEKISYGMVGYKFNGRALVYFGGFKKHIGFFPAGPVPTAIKAAKKYQVGKGTMRFGLEKGVPVGLVTRIVKWRVRKARETGFRS